MFTSRHLFHGTRNVASAVLIGIAVLAGSRTAMAEDVFTDLGGALAGVSGDPHLAASGTLLAGTPLSFTLTNAAPNSAAVLFISFSSSPVSFKGGVLQASPIALFLSLVTDGSGGVALPGVTPPGLPTDLVFFLQSAISDNAAVHHVSLSNAVKAHVPAPGPVIGSFGPVVGPPGTAITLTGAGFSSNPADVVLSVGGLLVTPVSGSPTSFTGVLGAVPAPDVLAETMQVVLGSGQMIGPGPGQFHFPNIPGIKSTGSGQIWNGNMKLQTFTTTSLFDKQAGPPDSNQIINQYSPNGVEFGGPIPHVTKFHLPMGSSVWGPNAHASFNFLFERSDGTSVAISNDNVVFDSSSGTVGGCVNGFAALLAIALGPNFVVTTNFLNPDWEILIQPIGNPPVIQVCGDLSIWIN